ncbi:MAG: beta-ketoacyl synthase N-terminal-like domain-containing protein [Formosimonas sp.]
MNVFLQGKGLMCGLGDSLDEAVARLSRNDCAPSTRTLPDGSTRPYFNMSGSELDWTTRISQLTRQAIEQTQVTHSNMPLLIASSCIHVGLIEETQIFPSSCWDFAQHIRTLLNWQGEVYLLPVACTASMQAMLMAQDLMRAHLCTEAMILGVELYSRIAASGFASMQLLSTASAQPLGQQRSGMVLGEAIVALHVSQSPTRWQLLGGASIVCGQDVTGASPAVVHQLCDRALLNSQLNADDIQLIKLQASGSPQNDQNEINGLQAAFTHMPALTTLKHRVGHTLGASGLVEIVLLTACLERKVNVDFAYELDETLSQYVVRAYPAVQHLLAIILGFSGEHAALVLKDCETA